MATLSNPTFYKGGVEHSTQLVGYTKATSDCPFENYVVRYTLTIDPNESGDHIYVHINTKGYIEWSNTDTEHKVNNYASLYFKIGTDPTEFANAGFHQISEATGKVYMEPYAGSDETNYNVKIEADVMLLPNTTYYIWIFPGFATGGEPNGNYTSGYFGWWGLNNHEHTINLDGSVGLVYINGDAYMLYIGNGLDYDLYIQYVGDGSGWDICT